MPATRTTKSTMVAGTKAKPKAPRSCGDYPCTVYECTRKFTRIHDRDRHVERQHNPNPFKFYCPECDDYSNSEETDVRHHLNKRHGKEYSSLKESRTHPKWAEKNPPRPARRPKKIRPPTVSSKGVRGSDLTRVTQTKLRNGTFRHNFKVVSFVKSNPTPNIDGLAKPQSNRPENERSVPQKFVASTDQEPALCTPRGTIQAPSPLFIQPLTLPAHVEPTASTSTSTYTSSDSGSFRHMTPLTGNFDIDFANFMTEQAAFGFTETGLIQNRDMWVDVGEFPSISGEPLYGNSIAFPNMPNFIGDSSFDHAVKTEVCNLNTWWTADFPQ